MVVGNLGMSQALRVFLVDDEKPAIRRLERLLEGLEQCEVAGWTTQPSRVVDECRRLKPDVVLLDVEMPGTNGVSVARALARLDRPPSIIFVTAYEQYAVDAFDLAAVDYLVKPVRGQRLAQALGRVVASGKSAPPALVARLGDRVMSIPIRDVRVLLAEDKYTSVHYLDGVALVDDSLVSLEQRYPGRFLRVHRNALIAKNFLRAMMRDSQGNDRVEIDGTDCRPEVSRRNLPAVRKALNAR
jgi:two-component system, LytTR family, response regulator AlgR